MQIEMIEWWQPIGVEQSEFDIVTAIAHFLDPWCFPEKIATRNPNLEMHPWERDHDRKTPSAIYANFRLPYGNDDVSISSLKSYSKKA